MGPQNHYFIYRDDDLVNKKVEIFIKKRLAIRGLFCNKGEVVDVGFALTDPGVVVIFF